MRGVLMATVAALAALATTPASADKKSDTLVWTDDQDPGNLDPYYTNGSLPRILSRNILDSLLYRDPRTGEYKPHLATSLTYLNPTTIEVKLREDVTFHDGEKLDADDVVYTINYTVNPANKILASNRVFFIAGAEKTGPYSLKVNLKQPFAAAFEFFATSIVIYPNKYHSDVGPEGMGRKPLASGPYRVTEFVPGQSVTMEAYKSYFGGGRSAAKINKVVFRRMAEKNTQVAELMGGGIDWMWRVPPDQLKALQGRRGIATAESDTIRFGLIMLDAVNRSGQNPLSNLKVRQAIAHAINRESIAKNLVGRNVRILHAACYPEQDGCTEQGIAKYDYSPETAKKLLAEAGYADGFEIPFWGYHERPWMEAMMSDLAKVGIRTKLNYITAGAIIKSLQDGVVPLSYIAWGSSGINHVSASAGTLFTDTTYSYTGDAKVTQLFKDAEVTTDESRRRQMYQQALARIASEVYAIPFYPYAVGYAFNADLVYEPDSDEQLRFYNMKWK